jgi:hypothetical protein
MSAFLILFALLVLLSAVSLILLVVAIWRRRVFAKTFAVLVTAVLFTGVLLYDKSFTPLFDDGPFQGRRCTVVPTRLPDQEVNVGRRFVLQTWDRQGGDTAPVVALREADRVRWCIYAEGDPATRVERVRFRTARPIIWRDVIDGSVLWTYGNERALWFIGRDGTLHEYWYSW